MTTITLKTKAIYEFNSESTVESQVKIIKKFEKIIDSSSDITGYSDYKVVQCSDDSLYVNITRAIQNVFPCNDYNKVSELTFQFCLITKTLVLTGESYSNLVDNNDDEYHSGTRWYELPSCKILEYITNAHVRNLTDAIALVELFYSTLSQTRVLLQDN